MSSYPPGQDYTKAGLVSVLSAFIIWGISDVSMGYVGRGQITLSIVSIAGFIFLAVINMIKKERLTVQDFFKSFPIGLQKTIVWAGLYIAYQYSNPAIVVTILSFSLVISIVLYSPLLGEKVSAKIVYVSLVGVVGLILTSVPSLGSFHISIGVLIALLLLPIFSASAFLIRNTLKHVPSQTVATYYFLWSGIITLPVAIMSRPSSAYSKSDVVAIAAIIVTGCVGHLFYNFSQKATSLQFNSVASALHVPSTALFAWIILRDTLAIHQLVGMAIALCAVVFVALTANQQEDQELEKSPQLEPEGSRVRPLVQSLDYE